MLDRRFLFVLCLLPVVGCGDAIDRDATTTESGLKYVELQPGEGEPARAGEIVTVHYTGWLRSNNKKFDSSVDRNEPFTFLLGAREVIPGWDEGVVGMKPGGKRRLIIPPSLAYGTSGAGRDIPPNAELVFEVELLKKEPGLRFEDLKEGTGPEAKAGDTVEVHYTGTLTTGEKFDSSVDRGEPFTFRLGAGEVIKGWDVGVAGMKEGGRRKLTIPSVMGYGSRGSPPKIPPNATLLFEVELLKVNKG